MPTVVSEPIDSPAVWAGADIASRQDWAYHLSDQQRGELRAAGARAPRSLPELLATTASHFTLPALQELSARVLAQLEGGRGFALIRGFPVAEQDEEQLIASFWAFGTHLGVADPQDRAGNRLHHVRDTGGRLDRQANLRAYQTSRPINYHNDGSDAFALLCVQAAQEGGGSRLVSAVAVFNEIVRRRPDLAAELQQPFHFDARGQQIEGAGPVQSVPIFTFHAGYLNVLYKREYIELAQRFTQVPRLTERQLEAMDLLDRVCDELALELQMAAGDIIIANNYDLLHARAAFHDAATDGSSGRHMLRLWLTVANGRPLPPAFAHTREFQHSYRSRQTA